MRKPSSLVVIGLGLCVVGCGTFPHDLSGYRPEVYMSAPPRGTSQSRLQHFKEPATVVYLLDALSLWPRDFVAQMEKVNPRGYPVYNLKIYDNFSWLDLFVTLCGEILLDGSVSCRGSAVEGDILLPEGAPRGGKSAR